MLSLGRVRRGAGPLFCVALQSFVAACAAPGTGEPSNEDASDERSPPESDASLTESSAPDTGTKPDAAEASTPRPDAGPPADASGDQAAMADVVEAAAPVWTCPPGPFGSPIPAGATPARIAGVPPSDTFNNTLNNYTTIEGPVWIGDALYVSEFPGNPDPPPSRILKITEAGAVSVAIADSGSNGLAVTTGGTLYGAIHEDGSISRFDLTTGVRTPVASSYMNARFNSPNDLTIRNDGNIYFSDPALQTSSPTQTMTRVYRVAAGTNAVSVVDQMLTNPNGVTLSLDQNTLFVSSNNGIYKYAVAADGSTSTGTLFAQNATFEGGSLNLNIDGMAIDCAGNLYGALIGTGNIIVLSPTATIIGSLTATGVAGVTNAAFGGADHQTLYISAQGSGAQQGVFQVHLNIPGMPY